MIDFPGEKIMKNFLFLVCINSEDTINVLKIRTLSCLPKKPRQIAQTRIRLLLQKQSDQGLHCLLFRQAFCEFQPW